MAEHNTAFASGVAVPLAEGVGLALYGSGADQDLALSSLPTNTQSGARVVHVRGTLVLTTATTGAVTIRLRQGAGVAGAVVQGPVIAPGAQAIGAVIPFEFIDINAASLPSLNYTVTLLSAATAGVGNITAEIEDVT